MNRDPYGRGGDLDMGSYPVRRTPASALGRPTSHGRSRHQASDRDDRPSRKVRPSMPLWQELPLLLIVAFCLAVLVRTFLFQAFFIPSGSMEHTLDIGDRVLVNKIVYDVRQPARGEVVVFSGTNSWEPEHRQPPAGGFISKLGRTIGDLVGFSQPGEKDFIKRVIGLPGDTVACCDAKGRVTVNGYPLDEPYVFDNSPLDVQSSPRECHARRFGPVTVGAGQLWVMGDHRGVSQDSRCQGTVPIDNVIGRAFVIMWPNERWAGLPVPKTFEKVPRPFAAAPVHPDGTKIAPAKPANPVVAAARSAPGGGGAGVPDVVVLFGLFTTYVARRRVPGSNSQHFDVSSWRD